jgi:hypothetical protein
VLRAPGMMSSDWRCEQHGVVLPLRVPAHADSDVLKMLRQQAKVPMWVPWPLLPGWTITGFAWVGDDRSGVRATAIACTGPAPFGGVADVVLVAEELGIGLGAHYAGVSGTDPGPTLAEAARTTSAHAKLKVDGHPTPLWSVASAEDRCAYVGEAGGLWLWAVLWPAEAGYLLADNVELMDGRERLPGELVYGAPSPYLGNPTL